MRFDEAAAARVEAIYQTPDIVEQRARTLERLSLQSGEQVLDLGCGPGLLASDMAAAVGPGGSVDAIDASPSMLALAARRCAGLPQVHLQPADVAALPFGDERFDAAVCAQVYEFVPDIPRALAELRRVLKPGGRAVIIDTDWESCVWYSSDDARMRRVLSCWNGHCPHPHLPRILGPLLRAAGLTVASVNVIPLVNAVFEPQTYSAGAIDMLAAYARKRLDEGTAADWANDLRALGARDEYFFSLNRYVFDARRPLR
jgi:arsenite methyltransferase